MRKSYDNDDRPLPYKVSFPGQYDPYEVRPLKDPRLGLAQKTKEELYRVHGFKDDDDDDVDLGSSEDETDKPHFHLRFVDDPLFPSNVMSQPECNPHLPALKFNVLTPYTAPLPSNASCMSQTQCNLVPVYTIPYGAPRTPNFSCMSQPEWTIKSNQDWKKALKRDVKNEAKNLKKMDCECAETAIKFYNQKHGTDYKIVETLGSYASIDIGIWFHCNFRAQCCESHPSPPKLFFAELNKIKYDQLIVKVCMPLDDGLGNRSHIVRGCEMCGNQLLHPVNGFEAGRKFVDEEETHHPVF